MNAKKPKISKKRLAIFSVFVFISAVFWFLSAMNREYTTKIHGKVEFFDFPEDVRPASEVPDEFLITVKGFGYDLIGLSGNANPLKISIKKYAVKDKNDKTKLVLYTHLLSDKFFPDVSGIEILSIDPETVVFKTEKLKTKKVPVKSNIKYSFKPLYAQSGEIKFSPDSITISGSEKSTDKIKFVETENSDFKNLKDSLNTTVNLKKIKGIRFSKNKINVIIPVEKYTENVTEVNLNIKNCPDSLQLITFPDKIKVTYKVVLSNFNSINEESFNLYVDYNDILNGGTEKLKVRSDTFPDYLKSVKFSPEFVEYIVEKIKTE